MPTLHEYRPAIGWGKQTGDGVELVRKFGYNGTIDTNTVPEDVWSGGGVWVAPTQARTHAIVSGSLNDTMAVRIWGLRSWNETETSEIVTLQGQTPVNTANEYVIIHRMRTAPGYVNEGVVTATAATDGTVTARIEAGDGSTSMGIYGIGSGYKFVIDDAFLGLNKQAGGSGYAEFLLQVALDPTIDETAFHTLGVRSCGAAGSNNIDIETSHVPIIITGPAIVKINVDAVGTNGTAVYGGLNGYLIPV